MRYFRSTPWRIGFFLLSLSLYRPAPAAEVEVEPDQLRPGLIATFTAEDGTTVRRRQRQIAHHWAGAAPDQRLPKGEFSANYRGRVWIQVPGEYRFSVYAVGKVRLTLAGKPILAGQAAAPRWQHSEPVDLEFGFLPIDLTFQKAAPQARLALFWSGPQFPLEPIAPRWLFHDSVDSPPGEFAQGRQIARALRCAACHTYAGSGAPLAAPALTNLAQNLKPAWLIDRLTAYDSIAAESEATDLRRMPHFRLSREQAIAIAAYLFVNSAEPEQSEQETPPKSETKNKGAEKKTARPKTPHGQTLLLTLGCLACHRHDSLGTGGWYSGGDLTAISDKRPPGFFSRWLAQPEKINRDHRMPVYSLADAERKNLSDFLAQQRRSAGNDAGGQGETLNIPKRLPADKSLLARGRQLVEKHRCASCHRLPEWDKSRPAIDRLPLTPASDWQGKGGCLTAAPDDSHRPYFVLTRQHSQQLRTYITSGAPRQPDQRQPVDGRQRLVELNCLGCHRRQWSPGMAETLEPVVAEHRDLARSLPLLSPPALNSVGDKFHREALLDIVSGKAPPRRPWLKVRMPRFPLSDEQAVALADYLIATDRIPPGAEPESQPQQETLPPPSDALLRVAGKRLVTADGFGCTSCHSVGSVEPVQVEPHAHGPNLSMPGKRIRRAWFDRWVRDPARIVPRMEMPAVKVPVPGVLQGNLAHQLAATWHVLNQPGFEPPLPNPVRVVRQRNDPESQAPAVVMTDNLETPHGNYVKPLLVALPNRHNVLFDQQSQRLAGWWIGDAARQRTRGKYWYWESAGTPLFGKPDRSPELALVWKGKSHAPLIDRALPPIYDQYVHAGGGIRFPTRLSFRAGDEQKVQVQVTQQFRPTPAGFRRSVHVAGLPRDAEAALQAWPNTEAKVAEQGRVLIGGEGNNCRIELETAGLRFADRGIVQLPSTEGSATVSLHYQSRIPADRFLQPEVPVAAAEPTPLPVVPGFRAERLPLSEQMMPTSLAWRGDGRLLIGSLKGRLWEARDSDGDGLEDEARTIGDELVQPFGIATTRLSGGREAIDVVDKTALLRLHDADDDGFFERTETLATGWGHSTDYHGWVLGLPRDEEGNYYVAVSQRGGPESHLRGRVLRLAPREPTAEDPRPLRVEPLTAGHRYPAGIARNRAGQLFVTDNQGNYNPFNELNHVRPGSHFGFVSKQDSAEVNALPRVGPSVAIPHPWTRSVNGICFLETPPTIQQQRGRSLFGPFEGHLIGCEYDTRRLIRISLQQLGDRFQGAAYPFSLPEQKEDAALLGPLTVEVAPDGDLYVGGIRDSAYGAGRNTGEMVRLRIAELPAGIAEVVTTERGFRVSWTGPVDSARVADPANYSLWSFRRIPTPAYGGPDRDRRQEPLAAVEPADDGDSVLLVPRHALRTGFVYELRIKNLTADKSRFHPALAYITLGPMP